jgi:hypothetical protein
MGIEGYPGNRGQSSERSMSANPHRDFVAKRLEKTRREALIEEYGEEVGAQRLATEIDFVSRAVKFLDTPGSWRKERKAAFRESIREEVQEAGCVVGEIMKKGASLYKGWLNEKHRMQSKSYAEQNPYPIKRGTDPNVSLGDKSHRNGLGGR